MPPLSPLFPCDSHAYHPTRAETLLRQQGQPIGGAALRLAAGPLADLLAMFLYFY